MRAAVSEFDELRSVDGLDLSQFPDPRQGEMIARWDMIASPPDVMVTNYSMLNVMLMRDIEEPLFTATRDWLASEPTNVFTLVVDELHLYRGTQGAEVAMIVRNLLDRLGLEADSSQLRCVATSASLTDDEEGLGFLEQFFGVERSSFFVTAGSPRLIEPSAQIDRTALLERWQSAEPEGRAAVVAEEFALPSAIASACYSPRDERFRATSLSTLSERMFDETDENLAGLEVVLTALSELPELHPTAIPLRAHLFARTMRGLWACSNPDCDQIEREDTSLGIGRLFSIPASTCACGGRVLELLYCAECGDLSLGGYVVESHEDGTTFLTPGPVDIPAERALPASMRPHSGYRWYRPGGLSCSKTWSKKPPSGGGALEFGFGSAAYHPLLGALQPGAPGSTGVVLTGALTHDEVTVPALPVYCPRCDQDSGGIRERRTNATSAV